MHAGWPSAYVPWNVFNPYRSRKSEYHPKCGLHVNQSAGTSFVSRVAIICNVGSL